MTRLFLDTSALVAVAFGEQGRAAVVRLLESAGEVFAGTLLEAEFLASLAREGVEDGEHLLRGLAWVVPDRRLTPELERVLSHGHLRGADAWPLATALFLTDRPADLPFLTLDQRQSEVAQALGFPTLP